MSQSSRDFFTSSSSAASVDEENAGPSANCCFGGDPALKDEREKLAKRVSAPGGITTGDYDHKTHLLERIGGGSFGEVYLGEMINTRERVAVKIEPIGCVFQTLLHEGKVYQKLQSIRGIPTVYWYGLHGMDFSAMVMDLMGPTLYSHWAECGERFSLKTVLMLVDQMVEIMEQIHANNVVHRDISPNNFMFGLGEKSLQIHLIDFGHAKELPNAPQFVPARHGHRFNFARSLVGTPRFASVFTHMGVAPSYRDDMESIGYIWIYLLKGRLPWQGLRPAKHQNKLGLITQLKINTTIDDLCDGVPEEFAIYMNYIRNLKHLELPNYVEIRKFFRNLATSQNVEYDWKFDWIEEKKHGNRMDNINERQQNLGMNNEDRSMSGNSGNASDNSDAAVSK